MTKNSDTVIAFYYQPGVTTREASLLAKNLMRFSGHFNECLHWIFELPASEAGAEIVPASPTFIRFTPTLPEEAAAFPFANKVFIAAEAELLADEALAPQLVWMDTDTLVMKEPQALILKKGVKIAIPPVHIQNISSRMDQAADGYWQLIYSHCRVSKSHVFQMSTLVDKVQIRPHFNAGLIAVNPQAGILRKWRDNFAGLYQDARMTEFFEQDKRYKLYLHQAVLAATIINLCKKGEIKLLPNEYNFPLHLINRMDEQYKPAWLNELVTARYDDFDGPDWRTALPAKEPYKSWLTDALQKDK
ncbi:MAG: hypothetical protein CVU42_14310 [Chloroflexi bacterium HGW-Chloroflexi-4]|jgi:hypothetical protein|nr:MAG: hypothetical protein CVU42_14310 [Chloroflexi bacterium HGW-Chloroflexi-4]